MRCRYHRLAALLVALLGLTAAGSASAYQLLTQEEPSLGLFTISPSRVEVSVTPGGETVQPVTVINKLGRQAKFTVSVQAFEGSRDPAQTVVFTDDSSPWSAARWISPELQEFTLEQGQRMVFNITLRPPADIPPGGRYGAVLIDSRANDAEGGTQVKLITRVGALLLVRVAGPVDERGRLTEFTAPRLLSSGPVDFSLAFENEGNIHQQPQGRIDIRNVFGTVVGTVPVEGWYVLPQAIRRTTARWDRTWLWGPYTATAEISHGRDTVGYVQATVRFWVLPWRVILIGLLAVVALWLVWRKYLSRLEIRVKR